MIRPFFIYFTAMEISELIEAYHQFTSENKYEANYPGLFEPIEYLLGLKSKKVRPLLALIGYHLYDDNIDHCLHTAHGLEVFHNFTLMHDDIMDEASIRRGQATVHEKFGLNSAILSGDAMAILAYQYILNDCKPDNSIEVLKLFSKTAMEICIGQQMDMEFEQKDVISSEAYIEMIRLKTAVFLGMALQIGAMIAGLGEEATMPLYHYGENLGIAFQIQDDLLDLKGDSFNVGKVKGGDILRKKKTILICKALEIASEQDKKEILGLLNNDNINAEVKVSRMTTLMESLDLFTTVEKEIDSYFNLAYKQLDKLSINPNGRNLLLGIAEMLKSRKG